MLGSGNTSSRGSVTLPSDMPPLPQCLPLDLITLGNQKYPRSGELRRVLGVPYGSMSEDHSFGVSQHKPAPPVATEELKHFKESVQDSTRKARDRVKNFREKIFKLDKYRESLNSKKRQRIDVSPIDRSTAANLAKMGSQIQRNSQDLMTQRLEDRTKSVGVNKRVRTSVADQTDGRAGATSRQQMVTEKDGDMLPAISGATIKIEEKIRRLPVGGEGWDRKMKRKRSVASVGNRVMNGDQDTKRAIQPKMSADSKLRSCDAQPHRSKSSPGVTGINKLDGSFELASSDAGSLLKTELESPSPRDRTSMLEQRVVAKGNNKPNIREDNPGNCSSTMLKGKASRGPRTGSIMVLDSSSKVHSSSGAFQGWEQPISVNKVPVLGVTNNQKRPLSASSSHAMAQWVGQRPHKNSRTRRANLVSPVSNNEVQLPSQSFSASDFGARTSSFGTSGSLLSSSIDNSTPKIKREFENVSSPFGLSESEESGAGDNKSKEKGIEGDDGALSVAHKVRSFALPRGKNKILTNEIGDGVRKQGRSVSGSPLTRPSIHLMREKLENVPTTKPLQSMRPASDKIKSKTGRPPSKKLKDRKASVRVGLMLNNVTSDFAVESDDDHEDLFAAANSARNASSLACSGKFWKKMESIFASLSLEDMTFLKQQLSFSEELEESLSQIFGDEYNLLGILVHKDLDRPSEGQESRLNQETAKNDGLCGRFDMGRLDKVTPLYQRVLSALIEEDEAEEFYHHSEGKNLSLHYASDDSHCGSCNQIDIEPKDRDRMESEVESEADFHSQKNCLLDRLSCDKSAVSNTFRNPSMSSSLQSNEQWLGDDDLSHLDVGLASEICSNDLTQMQPREINVPAFPTSDCQYQLMSLDDKILLELQSIGLYPETLPGLAEGEEVINQDVMELKEGLHQQIKKKKKNLRKLDKAIQKERDVERRNIEHGAMDQLIEIAYRKRMACRGNHTSKAAVRKVSRQVAMAFVKRTLARCRKFKDTGSSCFSEPALQDVLFSAPPCSNDAKSADCVGSGTASNTCNEVSNHQTEAKGSGAVSSTFKRYDTPSDNLDRVSSDAFQAGFHSSEHAFPKHGIILKKAKREVLIDDVVGCASSRVTSTLDNSNLVGGARGKRSEKDRDLNKDNYKSISVSLACRSSLDSLKNERKTKAKSKHKNNHSSTSVSGLHGRSSVIGSKPSLANTSNRRGREVGLSSPGKVSEESSKAEEPVDFANLQLNELDSVDIGVSNDLSGPQDLNSWLNFDGLQDHDSIGLEIPMDDLTDLMLM
ncbi:uncharacterized protein LOC116119352 isoform X3 [Pistacia vera]|uniref:uncharacterized protein LOC116119352 isoform X3 n=1 Tax=Pistacia vera TaxID=55513 RepID=UPI001263464A|nr:uncharacterized protein LOC116119352 isoform X3 [Pistacia vera]